MANERSFGLSQFKKNLAFPLSFVALVLLLLPLEGGMVRPLLTTAVLGIVLSMTRLARPAVLPVPWAILGWMAAAGIAFGTAMVFRINWSEAGYLRRLCGLATAERIVYVATVLGLLLAVLAVYVIYTVISWILAGGCKLCGARGMRWTLPLTLENLRKNAYLPVSATFFFALYMHAEKKLVDVAMITGICVAVMLSVAVAAWLPDIIIQFRKASWVSRILALLGSIKIWYFLSERGWYYARMAPGMALVALPYVQVYLLAFWEELGSVFRENKVFSGVSKREWGTYVLLLVASCGLCIWAFSQTWAFHQGTTDYDVLYDIIYTSDSASITRGNAYLNLFYSENDIRSPLFTLFAAPFSALFYIPLRFGTESLRQMLMNVGQLPVLLLGFFLLARSMELQSLERVVFVLTANCTYAYFLSGLMMEQYIYAFFWVALVVFLLCRGGKAEYPALCGAGGTMLTSLAFVPFSMGINPKKDFKNWFCSCASAGVAFLLLVLAAGRLEILLDSGKATSLGGFFGQGLTLQEKWFQFTWFVRNIFLAPVAGPDFIIMGHASWQLRPITSVSVLGLMLLAAAIAGIVWNHRARICQCAGGWMLFSVLVMVVMGWGTSENGLILYSLYFGWPYLVSIFCLVKKVQTRLGWRWLLIAACFLCSVVFLLKNMPELGQMVTFCAQYFPKRD